MRRLRFISNQPHEVLGTIYKAGDVLEVGDALAEDLLRRTELFEPADAESAGWPGEDEQ
jgi:hypothetical protein